MFEHETKGLDSSRQVIILRKRQKVDDFEKHTCFTGQFCHLQRLQHTKLKVGFVIRTIFGKITLCL